MACFSRQIKFFENAGYKEMTLKQESTSTQEKVSNKNDTTTNNTKDLCKQQRILGKRGDRATDDQNDIESVFGYSYCLNDNTFITIGCITKHRMERVTKI